MIDPQQHAAQKGWIESILHYIPGFHGYLDAEDRRESDRLARTHLVNRLTAARKNIDAWQEHLVNAGNLDDLAHTDRVVTSLITLGNRISGDVQGYSSFFDFVQIDNEKLERIYEHDLAVVSDVEALVQETSQLPASSDTASQIATRLRTRIDGIAEKYQQRTNILQGLESTAG